MRPIHSEFKLFLYLLELLLLLIIDFCLTDRYGARVCIACNNSNKTIL